MADAIKLHTAPQSFYKIDTKEVLPLYVVVLNAYEEKGETKYYDLSAITDITINGNMFTVDASTLVDYGYIKLVPNKESDAFKDLPEDVEDFGVYDWKDYGTITLKNKYGETFKQVVDLVYLMLTEFDIKETIKQSDLNEDDEYAFEITKPFKLFEWPFVRYSDHAQANCDNGIWEAEIREDGSFYITTDGEPSEEGEPGKAAYTFSRRLVGSPNPILPAGDGLMVNFRVNLELNITK